MESNEGCEVFEGDEAVISVDDFRSKWSELREEFMQFCAEVGEAADLKEWLAKNTDLGVRQVLDVYQDALLYESAIGNEGMQTIWTQKEGHVRCVDGFIAYEIVLVGPRDFL